MVDVYSKEFKKVWDKNVKKELNDLRDELKEDIEIDSKQVFLKDLLIENKSQYKKLVKQGYDDIGTEFFNCIVRHNKCVPLKTIDDFLSLTLENIFDSDFFDIVECDDNPDDKTDESDPLEVLKLYYEFCGGFYAYHHRNGYIYAICED